MRILLLFLIFAASVSAQEKTYKKGIVMDSIRVSDSLDDTYALFLPSDFDGKKQLPIIFIFDGEGRGISAARLFQAAAEEQGYILVSSNNVDPSKDLQDNLKSAALLIQGVGRSLPIDLSSISMAGLGDGAQVATAIPLIFNGIHGILYVGDHYFNIDMFDKNRIETAVGIVGNQQADIGEMEIAAYRLSTLSIPSQLYVFEGGMEWPESHLISSAIGNFTLQAMRSKKRPVNEDLIRKLYQKDLQMAEELLRGGSYLLARNFLDDLAFKYDDMINIREIKDLSRRLERSDNYKEQQVEYSEMLEKEQRLTEDFLFYYSEDVERANFENLGWWNFQKLKLQELTKDDNKFEAAMGYRLQEMLGKMSDAEIASFEGKNVPLEEKLMAYMLATVFDQQDFEAYKKVISLSTLNGDFPTALFFLEEMLKNGYQDIDALYEIEGTLGLKITKEYNWLIKKYLGRSRYFDNATSLD